MSEKERLLEELRREHDRQIDQLRDVDDKAMRSVRTATVIAGFVVAAVGITAREGDVLVGWLPFALASIGLLFLAGTVFIGSATYIVTEYPGRLDRRRLPQQRFRTHEDELIELYQRWTKLTSREISQNNVYVFYTVSSLFLGVLLLLTAGIQLALPHFLPNCPPRQSPTCFWLGTGEVGTATAIIFLTTISLRSLFMHDDLRARAMDVTIAIFVWLIEIAGTELLLSNLNG
jgi:hypothetical protein